MITKLYDKFLLVISIIAVLPLLVLALLVLFIGYPLHLIKRYLFS